jgi:solute:Na+ symporter, SSS family
MTVRWPALFVFLTLFALVTILGFTAARWKRGNLELIEEWGLAGRRFGTVITWFLVGGDFYTAYLFVAVPGLIWGMGAPGTFVLPYAVILYPIVYLAMPRLWSVSRRHGYLTIPDFVMGRYGSKALALAVALTGLLATMPYIALQLVGLELAVDSLGFGGSGLAKELPLILAFGVLAVYTYSSGLRAPAMIAIVKDLMIYIAVFTVFITLLIKLGSFSNIFHTAAEILPKRSPPGSLIVGSSGYVPYASLALGSALAAFLYPHTVTGILAASSAQTIKRNAILLPIYNLMFVCVMLIGFMCIGLVPNAQSTNGIVPTMLLDNFPDWFTGFFLAAIAVSALVPSAIMSIAAANIFTRNIWREYARPRMSAEEETRVAKIASLVVKLGALAFVLGVPTQYAINLQLLGGIWILQTLPVVAFGLWTRVLHPHAILAGWAIGMGVGTWMAANLGFRSAVYPLQFFGITVSAYAAIWALGINLAISLVGTVLCKLVRPGRSIDSTRPDDYVYSEA